MVEYLVIFLEWSENYPWQDKGMNSLCFMKFRSRAT